MLWQLIIKQDNICHHVKIDSIKLRALHIGHRFEIKIDFIGLSVLAGTRSSAIPSAGGTVVLSTTEQRIMIETADLMAEEQVAVIKKCL